MTRGYQNYPIHTTNFIIIYTTNHIHFQVICLSPHTLMAFFANCSPLNLKGPFHDLPKNPLNFFPLIEYDDLPVIPPYLTKVHTMPTMPNEMPLVNPIPMQQVVVAPLPTITHLGYEPKRMHSLSGEILYLLNWEQYDS